MNHASFVTQSDSSYKHARARMVESLKARGIASEEVLAAMTRVPRHLFVQTALRSQAYDDIALPIGMGQTISQPYTVARMCELLSVKKGTRVLEVGTGSGYLTAVLAMLGCTVFSVERVREFYLQTQKKLQDIGIQNVFLRNHDGTMGMPEAAPFERIIVSAGGPKPPQPLLEQLSDPGVLLIPIGPVQREQRLMKFRKEHGLIRKGEDCGPFAFVDLIGRHGW